MNSKAYVFIAMGFELIAAVLLLLWLGGKLDANYGWGGFGSILGIVIALVGWITHLLIMVRAVAKPENPGQIDRP